jgi:hypothetical protein
MSISGFLSDFSLPEIFQFIEKRRKTGLLTLRALPKSQATPAVYYIWVSQGRVVAAANRLDQQGLVSLIEQHQVVSDRVLDKLVHWCCPLDVPLGLYLKNQGVLQTEQLQELFKLQVLQQVGILFKFKEAEFKFDQNAFIPTREMTGLSIEAGALSALAYPTISPPGKPFSKIHKACKFQLGARQNQLAYAS